MTRTRRITIASGLVAMAIGLVARVWLTREPPAEPASPPPAPPVAAPTPPTEPPPERNVPLPNGLGWRGDGSGRYPDATPPIHWSGTSHVVWMAPLPGRSNATPVLAGDLIFVTAEPNLLIALRASDGVTVWRRQITLRDALAAEGDANAIQQARQTNILAQQLRDAEAALGRLKLEARKETATDETRSSLKTTETTIATLREQLAHLVVMDEGDTGSFVGNAAQTPVVDGQSVFVVFGSFVAASFRYDGYPRWTRVLPHPNLGPANGERNGVGASPMLAGDRLVIPMVQLYGLDPDKGTISWSMPGLSQWGTPARVTLGETDYVVTASGKVVRAWDGKVMVELTVPQRFVGPVNLGSLVIFSGLDLTPQASPLSQVAAVELPTTLTAGTAPLVLWKKEVGHGDYYGTPVISDGKLFALKDEGRLVQVLDLKTGEMLHERALPVEAGMPIPSLAIAGRTLHISFEQGGTFVLSTDPPYRQLAHNELRETLHASPVFSGSRMYLRTFNGLFCISETER